MLQRKEEGESWEILGGAVNRRSAGWLRAQPSYPGLKLIWHISVLLHIWPRLHSTGVRFHRRWINARRPGTQFAFEESSRCNPCVKRALCGAAQYTAHTMAIIHSMRHTGGGEGAYRRMVLCAGSRACRVCFIKWLRKLKLVHLRWAHQPPLPPPSSPSPHHVIQNSDGMFFTTVIKILKM